MAADLAGALVPVAPQNFAAITDPLKIGELLRIIDGYQGEPETLCALKLAPQLFVRPHELRKAEWSEFNLDSAATSPMPYRLATSIDALGDVVPLGLKGSGSSVR